MAEAAKLKEFLIALGFQVDQQSYAKFEQGIATATRQVVAFGAATVAATTLVVAGVAKMADSFESLYYASQRTKASVANIQAFAFAVSQIGGSAEGARGAIESLARTLRLRPGTGSIVGLDPNGDATKNLTTFIERIKGLPPYLQAAYGEAHGISEDMVFALVNNLDALRKFQAEYSSMQVKIGVDAKTAAESGKNFMQQFRLAGAAVDILGQKIGVMFLERIGKGVDNFRKILLDNSERITRVVGSLVNGFLTFTEVSMRLFGRVVEIVGKMADAFESADPKTQTFIKVLIAGWLLLNSVFLRTPLGILASLATALVLLYDDFKTWKAGGDSLFGESWQKWEKRIDTFTDFIGTLGKGFKELTGFTAGWETALGLLAAYIALKWVPMVMGPLGRVLGALALIPGSGVSVAALAALGITGVAVAALSGNKEAAGALGNLVTTAGERAQARGVVERLFARDARRAANEGANDTAMQPSRGGQNEPNAAQMAQQMTQVVSPSGARFTVAAAHAEQFQGFINDLEATGYVVKSGGGYNPRRVRGQNTWSWHAGGMAIDIDPANNPMDRSGRTNLPPQTADLARKWGLGNGASFGDPMHFSVGPNEGGNVNWRNPMDRRLGADSPRGNMASPGAGPVNQTNNINVAGNVDMPTANYILKELERPTQDMVRNQRGSAQ